MNKIISFIIIALLAVSCQSPRDKALKKIAATEKKMRADTTMLVNQKLGNELITSYMSFAEQFPEDSLAPEYLFKAAEVHTGIGRPDESVKLYRKTYESYPNFRKVQYCLFLEGFTYETQLRDTVNSKRIYNEFLVKYPNDQLANDVRFSLQNLRKSDEELIREFEAKQQMSGK